MLPHVSDAKAFGRLCSARSRLGFSLEASKLRTYFSKWVFVAMRVAAGSRVGDMTKRFRFTVVNSTAQQAQVGWLRFCRISAAWTSKGSVVSSLGLHSASLRMCRMARQVQICSSLCKALAYAKVKSVCSKEHLSRLGCYQ